MMASDDIAISVRNLTKSYRLFGHPGDRIKQFFSLGLKQYHRGFTALKDVSFDIRKGETVGIIGRNGSGKSTLLQLISGILKPTSGTVQVNGRVSALLELGAGFNPEFTGRENAYFQGAIMGFTGAQIDERFDKIAAFADIGEFIDQPVRTYSSGMYVRLAFSVAIHMEPEILIVDEALSVGDTAFQAKCLILMKALQSRGDITIVFVSHDLVLVKNLCHRVLTLSHGQINLDATPQMAIDRYRCNESPSSNAVLFTDHLPTRRGPRQFATLLSLALMDKSLMPSTHFAMGDRLVIEIEFSCQETLPQGRFGILCTNDQDILLHDFASGFAGLVGLVAGLHHYRVTTDPIAVYPGRYHLGAWIQHSRAIPSEDYIRTSLSFEVFDEGKLASPEADFSGIRHSNTETYLPCRFERLN
jgi:ABC-type polysaccharide/polyol phosphate transport system ATPase subunit